MVEVPPLRARVRDKTLLARALTQSYAPESRRWIALASDASQLINRHGWPGNRYASWTNQIKRAATTAEGSRVQARALGPYLANGVDKALNLR